jgi:hypothetical protein
MTKRTVLFFLSLLMLSSTSLSLFKAEEVDAVGGACYFTGTAGPVTGTGGCGVSGYGGYGVNDIFAGRTSAASPYRIPFTVNTKGEFINFVTNNFNGANIQNKIGAAFIMQEMRDSRKWPSNGDRDNWVSLMNQNSISVGSVNGARLSTSSWYDQGKRNTFYARYSTTRDIIVVRQYGRVIARIERSCGNLVAGTIAIKADTWDATPKTTRAKRSVKPGQNFDFKNTVTNKGGSTDRTIDWQTHKYWKADQDGDIVGPNSTTLNSSGTISSGQGTGQIFNRDHTPTANASRIGQFLCYYMRIKPHAKVKLNNGNTVVRNSWEQSEPKCIKVVKDIPDNSSNFETDVNTSTDFGEPNSTYQWDSTVSPGTIVSINLPLDPDHGNPQTGSKIQANDITWRVSRYVYPASMDGNEAPSRTSSSEVSCPAGTTDCEATLFESHANKLGSGGRKTTTGTHTIPSDLEAGSRICYVSSVYRPPPGTADHLHIFDYNGDGDTNDPGEEVRYYRYTGGRQWYISGEECVRVGKLPKVQIWGGDAVVEGDIQASRSIYNDGGSVRTLGSWGQYAVTSGGPNEYFASSAGYGTAASTAGFPFDLNYLTVSNVGHPTTYGLADPADFSSPSTVVNYYSGQVASGGATSVTAGSFNPATASSSGVYYKNGNVTINPATNIEKTVILFVNGKATIDGSLEYKSSYNVDDTLPQFVLIAKDIEIANAATRVDGWLITATPPVSPDTEWEIGPDNGSVNTCSSEPLARTLTYERCDNKLVVNGPVITSSLYLRRTNGARSEADRKEPAEIFNLRPDSFLWGYQQVQAKSTTAITVDSVELPPRF